MSLKPLSNDILHLPTLTKAIDLGTVLICLGYCIINNSLFLSALEVEKSKIKTPEVSVVGEDPCPGSQLVLFLLSLPGRKNKGVPWSLLQKRTNPIPEGSTFLI